jgi:CPA1 family monovalent cation:H+ antiporter
VGAVDVLSEAAVAVASGLAVGAACAWAAAFLHRSTKDPLLDNAISLLTPFVAYAGAEQIDGSGVLAVVICGLYLGHRWTILVSAACRLQMSAFWRLVEFLLESTLFVLVGLQLREVFDSVAESDTEIFRATVAVCLAVVLIRFVWVYPATYFARLVPSVRKGDPAPPLRIPTLIGWSGVRGALTLAAALTLPLTEENGGPFPHRDLLIWLACAVIGVTLLIQGTTLSRVARLLRIEPDDERQDALAAAAVQHEASQAAIARLEEAARDAPLEVVDQLRLFAERRSHRAWEKLGPSDIETPAAAYKRLRREMISAERGVIRDARNTGRIPESVMQEAEREMDLEESLLKRRR